MAAGGIDDDAAGLRQAVEFEGGEEKVQDARVIGVLDVLHIELPVIGECLGVAAENNRSPSRHHAADAGMDFLAEMLFQRRHFVGETAEHNPEGFGQAKLARVMLLHAEGGRHATLALDAVLESHLLEVALTVVAPGVIDAGESLGVAALLQRDQCTSMRAAVLEGVEFTVGVPADDDRGIADEGGNEVACVLHLDCEAEIVPGRSLKDTALLGGIDVAILEDPERHAGHALVWPDVIDLAWRMADLIPHENIPLPARAKIDAYGYLFV